DTRRAGGVGGREDRRMRPDLAALTPEAVAALSNPGLVKRAQREIEAGQGPVLEEEADGTVVGTFPDDVVSRLPPGKGLKEGTCSCGAPTVCRHRVAVALAYSGAGPASSPALPESAAAWDPGEVTDEQLHAFLGARVMQAARRTVAGGLRAEVEAGPPPTVRLPTTTVRFWVPHDLGYARCDCALQGRCEHLAQAVWCFRKSPAGLVDLGNLGEKRHSVASDLCQRLLRLGMARTDDSLATEFARAAQALSRQRMTWPLTLVEELQELQAAYRARSQRYQAGAAAFCVLSLMAREKAQGGELSTPFLLGQDTAMETRMDHTRLMSLGCRVESDGESRRVRLFLADPAGVVLVLERAFPAAEALENRGLAPDLKLGSLARGHLVSRSLKRRANRTLILPRRTREHSVTPLHTWDGLLPPLLWESHESWKERCDSRPPALLRPRVLAEDFVVARVASADAPVYSPGAQELTAEVELEDGTPVWLSRTYHRAAPGALESLAAALPRLEWVAGPLRPVAGSLVLEPTAVISGGRMVVPDLEDPPEIELPVEGLEVPLDPLAHGLDQAWDLCQEVVHQGLDHLGESFDRRCGETAVLLADLGLSACADRLRRLRADWFGAAVAVELARERLHARGADRCPPGARR
ncbi:MAG: hypothetical protein AB1758_25920, partial [Candidatus Eremiobacterota bacterium]